MMTSEESNNHAELPKLIDDGTNNNYGGWRTKAHYKLREWGLWKYIEGPTSNPPIIPSLRQTATYYGVDNDGHMSTTHVLGNATEHQQAINNAQPWLAGNEAALAHIIAAIPDQSLHLVLGVVYAKDAWECLRAIYQPQNSARAAAIKGQIMTYRCTAEMDVTKWLMDMQRLYTTLCSLEVKRMTDREFALAILDLMPQDSTWTSFVSGLCDKLYDADTQGLPFRSVVLISRIQDEHWCRHKDDDKVQSSVFTARHEALNRASSSKRPHMANVIATTMAPSNPAKRQRPDRSKAQCTNPHCTRKPGHKTAECIAYMGAKQGQYPDWWQGPWNIHLPESQRTSATNVPPQNRGNGRPAVAAQVQVDHSIDRSTTGSTQSGESPAYVAAVLTSDTNFHAWLALSDGECPHATLNALNLAMPHDDSCHHDSGANRHVFHNHNAFKEYKVTPPQTVQGFSENLSAIAIGKGLVRLESRYNNWLHSILLQNVLHIPAARTNLVSGIELDKAGIIVIQGNNSVSLTVGGKTIVTGKMVNDMYHLDLRIVAPNSVSLASWIASPSLTSQISLKTAPSGFYIA